MSQSRLYLDYNATSPLCTSVRNWITSEDFLSLSFANPNSHHQEGKRARKLIRETEDYLKELFPAFNVLFHSGATEGINTLCRPQNKNDIFIYADTDHPAVSEQAIFSDHVYQYKSTRPESLRELLQKLERISLGAKQKIILNITWVHNETGVIAPLRELVRIKEESSLRSQIFLHVDAVQTVGRIAKEEWSSIPLEIDALTFSGHKFGAMKGIGFSLFRERPSPLIVGGGQQKNLRSGTENAPAIYSLGLALREMGEKFNFQELASNKTFIETGLKNNFTAEELKILAEDLPRNANTISFYFKNEKADILLAACDLAGLSIGRGSACSLGQTEVSSVHLALGLTAEESRHVIRLSFSPFMTRSESEEILQRILSVIGKY